MDVGCGCDPSRNVWHIVLDSRVVVNANEEPGTRNSSVSIRDARCRMPYLGGKVVRSLAVEG